MEIGHPALLVLRVLRRRYQSLETVFRASQGTFVPWLRDFHSLLHTEVLLTCCRVKVRRPCLFSFSLQQHLLSTTKASLTDPRDNSLCAHIYLHLGEPRCSLSQMRSSEICLCQWASGWSVWLGSLL